MARNATLAANQWWAEVHHGVVRSHSVNFAHGPVRWGTRRSSIIRSLSLLSASPVITQALGTATGQFPRAGDWHGLKPKRDAVGGHRYCDKH
eukprot:1058402-Prymnesium_polylepis.1